MSDAALLDHVQSADCSLVGQTTDTLFWKRYPAAAKLMEAKLAEGEGWKWETWTPRLLELTPASGR